MKQIFRNRFIKSYVFKSHEELLIFSTNQKVKRSLFLDNTYGKNYFCYICFDSLTKEKKFSLSFCSDTDDDNLNLLVWYESRLIVLDTGKEIYFIDESLNVLTSLDITTPLIGLHLTIMNNLLILEEASMRLIDFEGSVLMTKLFDLIEEFNLDDGVLTIRTPGGKEVFELR